MQQGSSVAVGTRQQGAEAGPRTSPTRTWVTEPPPFGVASERFAPEAQKQSPDYHVAYRDVTQPPRWTAKGWVGIDDFVKPRRGTAPSVYGTSSLVQPSGPPRHGTGLAALSQSCPNEVRLQELLNLQRRRVTPEPGPGAYEPRDVKQHRRFRRQQDPSVDGPFFLDQLPDGTSTRAKEIAALFRLPADSGLGPGEYDGHLKKDLLMRSAPTYKLGISDREGRTPRVKSLSISRSIQNGIDWHVPVILQPADAAVAASKQPPADGATSAPSAPTTPTAASGSATRPSTEERTASYETSRAASPSGGSAAEHYLGAPPPPPSQVSRAVRRQQERRPGDWDWNRLGQNYRTTWTTLHGGAYSHGEHTPPRSLPSSAPSGSGQVSAAQAAALVQGIYPIQEESSSALERDVSGDPGPQHPAQHQYQHQYQHQHQQPQPPYPPPPQAMATNYAGPSQPYYIASFGMGEGGVPGPGSAGGVTSGSAGGSRNKPLISEEDLRRRRAAAELAGKAQQANYRVNDWQSKFAG